MLIRQGVQYTLARRVLASVVPALAIMLIADALWHQDQTLAGFFSRRGWAYVAVGALALIARAGRRQWLHRLDRHFFREQYDAQQILRAVAEDIRRIGNFERVAPRVVAQIEAALHPEFAALLVRGPQELVYRVLVATPAGLSPPPLRVDTTLIALLRVLVGDILLQFDGSPVQSTDDLLDLLAADRAGRTVSLALLRGGAPLSVQVTVGAREAS